MNIRLMNVRLAVSAAIIACSAAVTGGAQASIIPVLDNVSPDGTKFLFSYGGQLAADQGIKAGDELVIIDFAGYVPGSVTSSLPGVTASISYGLPTGLLLDPGFTDNSAIPDLVFTYNGPDFHASGGPYPAATGFTGLSADSTYGNIANGSFSAVAVKNSGRETGSATFNVGEVGVPSAVPEPAMWAMMLAGFFGTGFMLRDTRKRARVAGA